MRLWCRASSYRGCPSRPCSQVQPYSTWAAAVGSCRGRQHGGVSASCVTQSSCMGLPAVLCRCLQYGFRHSFMVANNAPVGVCAATSRMHTLMECALPPIRLLASRTVAETLLPPSSKSVLAAVMPAKPAPTMTTFCSACAMWQCVLMDVDGSCSALISRWGRLISSIQTATDDEHLDLFTAQHVTWYRSGMSCTCSCASLHLFSPSCI